MTLDTCIDDAGLRADKIPAITRVKYFFHWIYLHLKNKKDNCSLTLHVNAYTFIMERYLFSTR